MNAEGAVTQLSDHQQGSHARHESAEGAVSKLGHSLQRTTYDLFLSFILLLVRPSLG